MECKIDPPADSGWVCSQRPRAISSELIRKSFHHATSLPVWWSCRWCSQQSGTVNSSLTFRPIARDAQSASDADQIVVARIPDTLGRPRISSESSFRIRPFVLAVSALPSAGEAICGLELHSKCREPAKSPTRSQEETLVSQNRRRRNALPIRSV